MKKNIIMLVAGVMLLASCGTYTGEGAANGAYFGSVLGSAIGGMNGGPRGHDEGTVIGMVGGAVIGGIIGNAKDKQVEKDRQQYLEEKARLKANRDAQASQSYSKTYSNSYTHQQQAADDSGFNASGNSDDRVDIDFGNSTGSSAEYGGTASIEIRNARFVDENKDNILSRGETAEIVFDIYNAGDGTAYNLQPTVMQTSKNRHILVSPSVQVESLAAHNGVRYRAHIVADRMLKNGLATFSIAVLQGNSTASQVLDFTVQTSKR